MADTSNILSDFGINLLEEEIDDVIFQTNEFLTDATFTGSQGPFWWLLVVAKTLSSYSFATHCKSTTCSFLSRGAKPTRDKNGTKPRKNKGKNSFARNVLFGISSFRLQRYRFVPEMTRGFPYFSHLQPTFLPFPCTSASCKRFARNGRQGGKVSVKECFAVSCTFSKTQIGK